MRISLIALSLFAFIACDPTLELKTTGGTTENTEAETEYNEAEDQKRETEDQEKAPADELKEQESVDQDEGDEITKEEDCEPGDADKGDEEDADKGEPEDADKADEEDADKDEPEDADKGEPEEADKGDEGDIGPLDTCDASLDTCEDTEAACLKTFSACVKEKGEDTTCLDSVVTCLEAGTEADTCFSDLDMCFEAQSPDEGDEFVDEELINDEFEDEFGSGPETGEDNTAAAAVLAIGDSILEWNEWDGASIPEVAGQLAGMTVHNAAVSGEAFLAEAPAGIPAQFTPGNYQAVILNGGINDLPAGCNQDGSMPTVDSIIAPSGQSGPMFDLIATITQGGAKVVIVGYFVPYEYFEGCVDEVVALNTRYAALAQSNPSVAFVDSSSIITPTLNVQHYDQDKLHPSVSGSAAIGTLVADALNAF